MRASSVVIAISVLSISALAGLVAADDRLAKSGRVTTRHVSVPEGLEAWKRIEAVVTHPRCANCHVDANAIPIWTPAGETKPRPHGMNIHGGESRIGAEKIVCSTCHMTSTQPNDPAPSPPRAGIDWQLAPVAFIWFGKRGAEICRQLKDSSRNGGRDAKGLIEHLRHDASQSGFIPRAWAPGAGRSTPPGSFEEHVADMTLWGLAGQPCPD